MPSDVAISVRDLNKIYGVGSKNEKVALNNISLQVKKGSIFGLLGPNGAGKSTFINILADLVRKTSGHIDIFGMSHHEKLKDVKKLMGIVPQELNIDPFFTPYELLEIQAGLFGVPKNQLLDTNIDFRNSRIKFGIENIFWDPPKINVDLKQ